MTETPFGVTCASTEPGRGTSTRPLSRAAPRGGDADILK